jgi:hypothetical protein
MFESFKRGEFPIFHLNFGTIILLPKKENDVQIQQYCPIYLLNVSFKVFTKVGTSRVRIIAEIFVQLTQTTFMHGRYIPEGIVILHEIIHELYRKELDGFFLRLTLRMPMIK